MFNFFKKKKEQVSQPIELTKEEKETQEFVDLLKSLKQEKKSSLYQDVMNFELEYYARIAGTSNCKLLAAISKNGEVITDADVASAKETAKYEGYSLLYTINYGTSTVIFGPYTELTGITYSTGEQSYHD